MVHIKTLDKLNVRGSKCKVCTEAGLYKTTTFSGGWGKPPVNEQGQPLYGDVFGTDYTGYKQVSLFFAPAFSLHSFLLSLYFL